MIVPDFQSAFIGCLTMVASASGADLRLGPSMEVQFIGFIPCGEIAHPKELAHLKITNPDAPTIEHCVTVIVEGQSVTAVPILFSRAENYDPDQGGDFFAYLTFKLMAIEKRAGKWTPAYLQSKLRLLDVNEVEGFHDQIGQNTKYIIHPEEILADNFVLLVNGEKNVRTPRIIREMRRFLSETAPSPSTAT